MEILINHVSGCEDVLVYPITGMGGIGKTTLAQLVLNEIRVASHFETRIWVWVSKDFDVWRILKAIIESTSERACEDWSLSPPQDRLRKIGKRYFLVLEDIWNEDQEKWERLKGILKQCGSRGVSIIVTTHLEKVASIMGTLHSHQLKGLSKDDCWLLFKLIARLWEWKRRAS